MQDWLITLATAQSAKASGFNAPTAFYFRQYEDDEALPGGLHTNGVDDWNENDVPGEISYWSRPTQSLLQAWLREQCKLSVEVRSGANQTWGYVIVNLWTGYNEPGTNVTSYEEALELGLQASFKLFK